MNLLDELSELKRKIEKLEDSLFNSTRLLKHVKGNPIIQGYATKKLDLNDNLNVVELLKRVSNIETRLGFSSELIVADEDSVTIGKFKFKTDGNTLRLYYSATGAAPWTDTGTYWQ
jgi:hypothetical protein